MADQQVRILFSEAHGERLRVNNPEADLPCTRWAEALKTLTPAFKVDQSETALTEEALFEYDILTLGAPMEVLNQAEIGVITRFVSRGGGLLVINDAEAVHSKHQNLNQLSNVLPCQVRKYLNAFPRAVEEFRPHYVTAGLVSLTVAGNCRLTPTSDKARPLAVIPETDETFALCSEVGNGRVIVVADSAPFADAYWEAASNHPFAVQCCLWLARRNPVDLYDVTVDSPIEFGRTGTLVLELENPGHDSLQRVQCILEANTDTTIAEGSQEVHAIPSTEKVLLRWKLQPRALGVHHLRLIIEIPADASRHAPILFNRVAEFMCATPVTLKLEVVDGKGQPKTAFATGERFRVEGTVEWLSSEARQELPLDLSVSNEIEILHEEVFGDVVRWYLQGNTPGHYDVKVAIPETEKSLIAGLRIQPSLDWQRESIKAEYLEPLDAEIIRRLVRVHPAFGGKSIEQISFHILSPEEYVRVVYPAPPIRGRFQEILTAARRETRFNLRLLNEILLNMAPIYSVRHGACVPFDPAFASHWAELHPAERESLFYNFIQLEDSDPATIRRNLAAYLLHEKYGHGFFFAHTRLGQQLAVLDRHHFLREVDKEILALPYPRSTRQRYAEAIKALDHSAIILNEGFAAWVELNFLAQMESEIAAAVHPRRVFLTSRAERLGSLKEKSSYFKQFPPLFDSPYQEGYEKLEAIQRMFGDRFGERCAMQVFLKATEVSLGVKEGPDGPEFGLSPEEMLDALINPERPDDARSDRRLRRIYRLLIENRDRLRSEQRRLQCHRECRRSTCPMYALIATELGW